MSFVAGGKPPAHPSRKRAWGETRAARERAPPRSDPRRCFLVYNSNRQLRVYVGVNMAIEIAFEKVAPVIIKITERVAPFLSAKFAESVGTIKAKLTRGFKEYTDGLIERYSKVRTIIPSSSPIYIYDIYVNMYIYRDNKYSAEKIKIKDDDILQYLPEKKRIVYSATAGAGKSMLLRYMYFIFITNQEEYFPIFLELRDLNNSKDRLVIDYISEKFSSSMGDGGGKYIDALMRQGKVVLFLDGFDEIDFDFRAQRGIEINQIAEKYNNMLIVVSTRPDEDVNGWDLFEKFRVAEMSLDQVYLMLKKIPYDEDTKAIFKEKIQKGLYNTHKEFLVNPLLFVMMLITIEQYAEIPAKIHLFYEHAFEALFARHDVTKGRGFHRKRHVDIAIDDYRRLLSYFSTIGYLRQKFTFSEMDALELIEKSSMASQIRVIKTDMLKDLVNCTCIISRDGLEYVFSHRSFQEYFVAYFFARVRTEEFVSIADRLAARGRVDSVFIMMSEMNKEKFEEEWIVPNVEKLFNEIKEISSQKEPIRILTSIFCQNIALVVSRGPKGTSHILVTLTGRDFVSDGSYSNRNTRDCLEQLFRKKYDKYYSNIHKEVKQNQSDLLKAIKLGKMYGKDVRFDCVRMRKKGECSINLTASDDEVVGGTFLSKYAKVEKEIIHEILSEVKERVEGRRRGLQDILKLYD